MVMTGTTPRPRRSRDGDPGAVAPPHAGVSHVGRVGWLGGGP
jgi:hypothetical protein